MKKKILLILVLILTMIFMVSCGDKKNDGTGEIAYSEISFDRTMELQYAHGFTVSYSDLGYKHITISDDQDIILVPEGKSVPSGLPAGMVVLKAPLDNIYMVATAIMDHFGELDAIKNVTLSSQTKDNWSVEKAVEAMERGELVYAGKYSAPDYELILSKGCDLAIESTMIYHSPKVKEKMESLGIPVIVERSGYESDPLGRMEWIKFCAALVDKEEMAEKYFDNLIDSIQDVLKMAPTDKSVAIFYITSNGAVSVRKSGDYITKALKIAGGNPILFDAEEENAFSTMNIQMEVFYREAHDADILIYNSTIVKEIETIDELLGKSSFLKDFKAVKEGNVWCIEKNFYQQTLSIGDMMIDLNKILNNENVDEAELRFLHKLK